MVPKVILVLVALLCLKSCSCTFTEQHYQDTFTTWMHDHNKFYTPDAFTAAYTKFKEVYDSIAEWNAAGHSHTVGLNQYSDLTHAEFNALLLHPIRDTNEARTVASDSDAADHSTTRQKRTTPVDWRNHGAVSSIKNQGTCGSCWAFASAASVESIHQMSGGPLADLSPQQLLDCTTNGNNGCNGGVPYYALQYAQSNGVVSWDSYLYQGTQGSCASSGKAVVANINGVVNVAANSESALETAVTKQPVVVLIDASLNSFKNYKSGIYNDSACTTNLNHVVLVVGFDVDSSGYEYWIVKNSWGTSWGLSGYFYLAKNAGNRCGVAKDAMYPTSAPVSSGSSGSSTTGSKPATSSTTRSSSSSTTSRPASSTTARSSSTTARSSSTTARSSSTSGSFTTSWF